MILDAGRAAAQSGGSGARAAPACTGRAGAGGRAFGRGLSHLSALVFACSCRCFCFRGCRRGWWRRSMLIEENEEDEEEEADGNDVRCFNVANFCS